jgi:UDPglucose 6-dehydrogenase
MDTLQISVFGLGKLGCTMMACFAHKGWHVIGVDINQASVDKINAGESPIFEPGVAELIKDNKERIEATSDPFYAANKTQVSFIIVPTPSLKDGSFSTESPRPCAGMKTPTGSSSSPARFCQGIRTRSGR